jgi:C_GCAxxG_C_C family probable redox protein
MTHSEIAKSCHERGFNCAQSVLAAFCQDYGLETTMALKISTGFGSGMGRLGEVCGALTGGFMVIGLKYGKINSDGTKYGPATETTYSLVQDLARKFTEHNQSIFCKELTGLDLLVPENREYALKNGIFSIKCSGYIQDVVAMLEEILKNPNPTDG